MMKVGYITNAMYTAKLDGQSAVTLLKVGNIIAIL